MLLSNRFVGLLLLAAVWGATFSLIRVAVRDFEPEAVLASRMLFGGLTVLPIALARFGPRGTWRQVRPMWWKVLFTAVFTFFAPTLMLSWAETRIDSGLAAVLVAGAPLYAALLSLRIARHDTVSGLRLVGLFVGFAGVAMLVGVQPGGDLLAALVVALVGVFYATATLLTDRWLGGVPPVISALGMFSLGSLVMIPVAIPRLPSEMPDATVLLATVGLGVLCTGLGFMLFITVVTRWGASFGVLVNYLVPAVALFYGALFLGESITLSRIGGLLLVLLGVGMGSGVLRRRRAAAAAAQAPDPDDARG
jgi:drug/metabolite transporter (DMT)-like permease